MVEAAAGDGGRSNGLSIINSNGGGSSSSSAPRVYVPVSVPESNVPTYAVLELVGFSTAGANGRGKSPLPSPSTLPSPSAQSVSASGGGFYRNYVLSPIASPVVPKITPLDTTPPASPSGSKIPAPAAVSISQTERETIVHTSSDKFKDVVRQLTGASSDDTDLMPVTLPARLANRCGGSGADPPRAPVVSAGGGDSSASKADLGLRKAPLKLHERRKALRNLERLSCFRSELGYSSSSGSSSSSCSSSPLAPSPVTPLVSDFERFCNARTPTAAEQIQKSSTASALSLSVPSSPRFPDAGIASAAAPIVTTVMSPHFSHGVSALASPQRQQMPAKAKEPPVLLNLFPEGPLRS